MAQRVGRPKLDPEKRGKVVTFWSTPELRQRMNRIVEYTGSTVSAFLREAVEEYTRIYEIKLGNEAYNELRKALKETEVIPYEG